MSTPDEPPEPPEFPLPPWDGLGVDALRAVFEAHRHDRGVLIELRDIMAPRRRGRKRDELKADIEAALAALDTPVPAGASTPPPEEPVEESPSGDVADEPDDDEDEPSGGFQPPREPTRISPVGVEGRPASWFPPNKEDLALTLGPDAPLPLRYAEALEALIAELDQSNRADHLVEVSHGQRLEGSPEGMVYRFRCTAPEHLFEQAQVKVEAGPQRCSGTIAALAGGTVHLAVEDDLGAFVPEATLRVDATALLRKLAERMAALGKGEVEGFDLARATAICSPQPVRPGPPAAPPPSTGELNARQAQAVSVGLDRPLLWLWGPPGTGKTRTLGVLVRRLLDRGERVLICSNTNQAVDQVLLKLCMELGREHSVVRDGQILRVGRIAHEELKRDWSDYVTLDGIVARLGRSLREEQAELAERQEQERGRLAQAEAALARFEACHALEEEATRLTAQVDHLLQRFEQTKAARVELEERRVALAQELEARRGAGFFAGLLMRGESRIIWDQEAVERDLEENWSALRDLEGKGTPMAQQRDRALERARAARDGLPAGTLERWRAAAEQAGRGIAAVDERLAEIATILADLGRQAAQDARVLGATVTRLFLSPEMFAGVDTVVVDEASMVTVPALFNAVGLARRGVVISGDFRQLSPIVESKQQAVLHLIGGSVFQAAGIVQAVDRGGAVDGLVPLQDQYRMVAPICSLVSQPYYAGLLRTGDRAPSMEPSPLPGLLRGQAVSIVDTSGIQPFARKPRGVSRSNLMHALAVRNLLLAMRRRGTLTSTDLEQGEERVVGRVGVCTPYSAQSRLLQRAVEAHSLDEHVAVGTVHRFQGDEKDVIIFETTDSVPSWKAGLFYQADQLELDGARLLNVAVTRARTHLVIVANLDFLERKLPSRSYLREVLHRAQAIGAVTPVEEVLALEATGLAAAEVGLAMPPGVAVPERGFFASAEFKLALEQDLRGAKRSIVIFSGFATVRAVESLLPVLRSRLSQGVKVRCVTRPPANNGSMGVEEGTAALRLLRQAGCAVDTRWGLHEKAVVIDERVVWFGSLNVLSHGGSTSEMMARMEGQGLGRQVLEFLRPPFQIRVRGGGVPTAPENPECPECHGLATLHPKGKYGPYWQCHDRDGCGWRESARWPV